MTDKHRLEDCDIFKRYQHKKSTIKEITLKPFLPFLKVQSAAFYGFGKGSQRKNQFNDLKYLTILTI